MEDPYGQLYILPQAEVKSLSDLILTELPELAQDIELPLIQGPAFPLFDMTRAQRAVTDYQVDQGEHSLFNIYYKNDEVHSYVVFANMWEVDGDTALDV